MTHFWKFSNRVQLDVCTKCGSIKGQLSSVRECVKAPTPGQAAHDKELTELRKLLVPIRSPR